MPKITKSSMYEQIIAAARKKGLRFERITPKTYRSEDVFCISNEKERVYGKINTSNSVAQPKWAGISLELYRFFNSNKTNNFLIMIDERDNHFLTIPFSLVQPVMLDGTSTNGRGTVTGKHKDFHFSRPPYWLKRGRVHDYASLERHKDNLAYVFESFTDHFEAPAVPNGASPTEDDIKLEQWRQEEKETTKLHQLTEQQRNHLIENYEKKGLLTDINDNEATTTRIRIFERDPKLAALLKLKSNYTCQICETRIFEASDGNAYVESHHIIPRAKGGADDPRNIVIVCANCHCKFDSGNEETQIQAYKILKTKRLFSAFQLLKEAAIINEKMYHEITKPNA